MAIINSPPASAVDTMNMDGELRPPSEGWRAFFNAVFNICTALTASGTTAQRPTKLLWIGRTYFDTSLGIPIWYDANGGTGWCDATGGAV